MASEHVAKLTDGNFESEVVKSEIPVVVDFWAEWCGPCKMLTPVLDELAQEYDGRVKIGSLNVDENPTYASRFGITSIPTLLFVKNGEVAEQQVGLAAKGALKEKIDRLLG